ncbi:MAG: hypothetical protein CMJ53_08585 [Planctomycetaceae bacterium]|nr:hypothetical protein [Planctomycetaceae bacterium]|tara:strand:+ start:846 stop:1673 length:828 start_codon:yes stop_codon:yes gene_type:complete
MVETCEQGGFTIIVLIATLFISLTGMIVVALGLWFGVPVVMRSMAGKRIRDVCRRQKLIALTFDDGPVPGMTERVLEMLDELGVKATFFMIGSLVENNEDLARQVVENGHQVASHTQNHLNAWRVGPIRGVRDVQSGVRTLRDRELAVSWFRPPRGNATLGTVLSCWSQGCRMIWWTHDSGDTGFGSGRSDMGLSQIMKKMVKGKAKSLSTEDVMCPKKREGLLRSLDESGGVVLFHDGKRTYEGHRELTLECTRDIVRRAKENGFRFVTLNELK